PQPRKREARASPLDGARGYQKNCPTSTPFGIGGTMKSEQLFAWAAVGGALVVIAAGCSSSEPAAKPTPVPGFTDTTGEAALPTVAYPAGPYGIGVGSVIA